MLVATSEYRLEVIDLADSRQEQLENTRHQDWIQCIAASSASSEIATGSVDGGIRVWDANTGALVRAFVCEGYAGHLFVFSKDGKFFFLFVKKP